MKKALHTSKAIVIFLVLLSIGSWAHSQRVTYPNGVSVSPTTSQTRCVGIAATELTATITTCVLGSSGPASSAQITYTWYYNTSNTNDITGATVVQTTTTTAATTTNKYTPPTTSAAVGTRYYFVQVTETTPVTGTGCGGSSAPGYPFTTGTIEVTVTAQPTTAAVTTTPLNYCGTLTSGSLGGNTPTVGTGAWSQVSGPGTTTFSDATSGSSTATASIAGTYIYRWTTTNGTCTSSANVTVNYYATPSTATVATTPLNYCGTLTTSALGGNTPTVGTGAWSKVSGPGTITFSNSTSGSSTATASAIGTYVLRWTISNGTCTPSTADVQVNFHQNPTTAAAGADQNVCGSSTTLAGNTPSVGTGSWSIVSGTGGSFGDASAATSTFSGTAGTSYTLRWTISNSSCTPSTDDVVITFTEAPTTANAGADQTGASTCGSTTVTLAGNTPAVGTGVWSKVSGTGGSFGNVNDPSSAFSGTAGITYVLRWTISNNPCTASSDDVTITFNELPTAANAGADQTGSSTCGSTTVALSANNPTKGTGAWSIVSGTGGSFSNALSRTSNFTGTAGSTYTLRWTTTNGPCTSADDVVITFNQNPTTAAAGADQNICGTSATLAANAPGIGTGAWSIVSGTGGSFVDATDPASSFSGTAGTTYTLRWTISNSPCTASSDDVVIAFKQEPTAANAGTDQTGSATCGLTSVTLAGNVPTVGTGTWSIVSGTGGSFTNANSATSAFSGTAGTTYTLRWTISNSPCTASADDVVITFNRNPTTAAAGADQNVCGSSTTLAGNTPSVGTGSWSVVSGTGGSFGDASVATSTFSGTAGTSYTLRWTISNSSCTPSTDDVVITFTAAPTTANAGADQTGASTCGSTTVTLAGNTPAVGTGVWSKVSGTGGSFGNVNDPSSTFSGTAGITYVLRWTISNNPCTASSDDVTITFNELPTAANAGADQTGSSTCGSTTVALSANNPTKGTGAWSIVSGTGGSFSNALSRTSNFTGTAGSTYTLRWTTTNGPCTSADDVVITFNIAPTTADAGANQNLCAVTTTSLAANSPDVGTGAWSIITGTGGSLVDATDPATSFSGTAGNSYKLRWTITNGPCTSSDDVVINFDQAPTTSAAGADQEHCETSTATLAGNTPAIGTGTWTLVSGTGTITTPSSSTSGVTGLGYGANVFRWSISNGSCTASADDVTITRYETPTTSAAGDDQQQCETSTATLAGNTPTVGTGTWTLISGTGTITQPSSPTSEISGLGYGANVFRWTISNGACTASADNVTITRYETPTTSAAGDDQQLCVTSTAALAGNTPTAGTGSWTLISGTGTITTPSSPTSEISGLGYGANVFRWTISNGSCTASADDVTITRYEQPVVSDQPNQALCNTSTFTMTQTIASVGTGVWTLVSGSATIREAASPITEITGVAAGSSATVKWTVTNGTCSAYDEVTVTNYAAPVPTFTASPSSPQCSGTDVTYTTESGGSAYTWTVPGIAGTDYSITSGGIGTTNHTVTLKWLTPGSKTVTVNYNNSNGCTGVSPATSTITVNGRPDITTTTLPSVKYSEAITGASISVTDDGGAASLTLVSLSGLPAGLTYGAPQINGTAKEWPITGTVTGAPGTYNITIVVSDGTCTSTKVIPLVVNKDDLCVKYNGQLSVSATSTSRNSCKASFALSVGVFDADGTGDVTKVQVQFYVDGQASGSPVTVQSLNTANTMGNATKLIEYSFNGTYVSPTIRYEIISSYYQIDQSCSDADGNVIINIYLPQNEFISGGGFVNITNSVGTMAATAGNKANFGFNVKYTKSGTNLQGNINYIFRQLDANNVLRVYQVKGNAMSSLSVNTTNPNERTAIFTGKCNVSEIVGGTTVPVNGTGNSVMQVIITDRGEPGTADEYGITVWSSNNQLYHSSNWIATGTVKQVLGGGNIQVNGATSVASSSTARTTATGIANIDPKTSVTPKAGIAAALKGNGSIEELAVTVMPNPSPNYFTMLLSGGSKEGVTIRVTDVSGKVIELRNNVSGSTIQLGNSYRPGVYIAEIMQGSVRKTIKLIKL